MSGPVWQYRTDGPFTCDECLATVDEAYILGRVEDGELRPERTLCEACYLENASLIQKTS